MKQIPAKSFPYVKTPFYINSEQKAYTYVALNYWQGYCDSTKTFSKDTNYIGGITKNDFNRAFTQYINILNSIPPKMAFQAQLNTCKLLSNLKTEDSISRVWEYYFTLSEQTIYNVSSNTRNEELYLPVLETAIKFTKNKTLKESYKIDLADVSKNRLGEKAINFKFTTKNGMTKSLIAVRTDYTLVFFSNPECSSCKQIIEYFHSSDIINSLIASKKLSFLNIYIDENLDYWFKYMSIYPKNWVNAYNPNQVIKLNKLYNIRAIPTIYLLDKEKRVIMKDALPVSVTNYFTKNSN